MSFLAWAFGLGLLAVGFPVLFHLIRRAPRGRQVFSSLMFLESSPPRITRRSRVDDWLLLLLRGAALGLLALAFMRPFVRETAFLGTASLPNRLVAVVVDRSASLRRGTLWNDVQERVRQVLSELEPGDEVALFAFDDRLTTLVALDESSSPTAASEMKLRIVQELSQLTPSWRPTDLGRALVAVADNLQAANTERAESATMQIVVVSDLQRGADLTALQAYEWPEAIAVDLRSVAPVAETNASVRLLADRTEHSAELGGRVRVTNAAISTRQQFSIHWSQGTANTSADPPISVVVPAGTSQIINLPRRGDALAADQLVLVGDDADFDNRFYCVPLQPVQARVVYWGNEAADDPEGMRYYLERAFVETELRHVEIVADASALLQGSAAGDRPDLIFVTSALEPARVQQLQAYVADGGTVFAVLTDAATAAALEPLLGRVAIEESATNPQRNYTLLAELDFAHPLLLPLAAPQYNDFTKIRFWQTTPVASLPDGNRRIASFDDGRPALWEVPQPRGAVFGLAASWSPAASQFALSSKFVTLLNALLDQVRPGTRGMSTVRVGEPLPLPTSDPTTTVQITRPDGSTISVSGRESSPPIAEEPGIYRVVTAGNTFAIAANLPAAESDIEPLPTETLRAVGVSVGQQPPRSAQLEQLIRLKDLEFESRQKIWKWLLVGAILALLAETFLAGRRTSLARESTPATTASLSAGSEA